MGIITIFLHNNDGDLVAAISGTFTDADLELLRQFVAAIARVRNAQLLKHGLPAITNMNWSSEGMKFTCEPYTDAELFELLHVLRHVVLPKEATSFDKIGGLLGRRFASKEFASHMQAFRSMFKHGELKSYMQISVGGQPLFDESLLHMWLNGTQYHTDAEKAKAWKSLDGSIKSENARALVMNQLHSKVKALFLLENVVDLVLQKHGSV